jgi:CheY-like chemotaxis protein
MKPSPHQKSLRILVVDDNADAAMTLAALLGLWGHQVRAVTSGMEGIETARIFRPELVLLDFEMPRMHGGTVAEVLRQMPALEQTAIVAVSATPADDYRLDRYRDLFDDFLRKPYNLRQLEEVVTCVVSGHRPIGVPHSR